ncbi:O-acetyl-ADP-ribose deacetylase [Bavariicoccus seileri]|uniref:O-acetyl-ADP-ribose deacetylase n=1 Tax=Bavariicoccus seileri TaxID=549685 RepID=UPI0003B5F74C|nr:O-acetyl-ADP-ribose deacetylase [Bavariicoccus seileri]
MSLKLIQADITQLQVDAIVNAANSSLLGGGGVDGAIHRAAGKGLLEECRSLGGCATGDAVITKGYQLPAKYIIHAVGPVWRGGQDNEVTKLKNCYQRSLEIAAAKNLHSIAFSFISAGVYGFPRESALRIAVETILAFEQRIKASGKPELDCYLVLFDSKSVEVGKRFYPNLW